MENEIDGKTETEDVTAVIDVKCEKSLVGLVITDCEDVKENIDNPLEAL